ncbi:protein kinase domain-containing protein [Prauserella flavalba]|uniref:non-specific serine/threonine protein kinase n=1 Tax=Prauserella flavalba TaxID=1477506 RepID=A0A318LL97_9PSEU|nr:serine/threonine-protein kinase [Prauserella flavalba]PXY35372.1 hypothetical protein BA062_07460 [Prauserella flavalba]
MSEVGKLVAGRYRVRRRLGGGTTSTVWKAVDERLKRPVAIKQLRPDPAQAERAVREGREASRLRHPHVVSVHDVDDHDGSALLIMEYFPSRSLDEVVAEDGPLPPMEAARVGAQVASALAEAHQAGIVHGDVTPGTVLVGDDGTVKLGGFVSPAAKGRVTPDADVHALGATLSEILPGGTQAGPLAPVLDAMLAADPAERSTAAEAAEDLRAVAEARALVAAKQPALVGAGGADDPTTPLAGAPAFTKTLPAVAARPRARPRPAGPAGRRRWLPAALAVLGAVLVTVVLLVVTSSEDDSAGTTPGTAEAGGSLTASASRQAVAAFYAPLPGGTDQAWERLGPGLRAQGRDAFDAYWSGVAAVIVVSAPKVTAAGSVHVGVELTLPDGSAVTEFHQFGVIDRYGTAVLDSDTLLHTETSTPAPPSSSAPPEEGTPGGNDGGDAGQDPAPAPAPGPAPTEDDGPGRGRGNEHGNPKRGDG